MRRIGLGWLPGASIGVLSGFFIFNEPLREFHAVQQKKTIIKNNEKSIINRSFNNNTKSTEKKNENSSSE